jgi:hypothetical protein
MPAIGFSVTRSAIVRPSSFGEPAAARTIIRMGPAEASQFSNLLTPGQTIAAQGWALNTAYGKVVDAQTINPAPAQAPTPPMSPVPPPPR